MLNTSQEWKNLLSTQDILPESNVNIISDGKVLDTSNFSVSTTDKAPFSNANFMAKAPRNVNREQRKIATLEWNFWVLDGSYEIPTEESIAVDRFISDEVSDINGDFANPPTIYFTSNEPIYNPPIYTLEFMDGFASQVETPAESGSQIHNIQECGQKYLYLETYQGSSRNNVYLKINSWSMPYRRARVSEFLLGARIYFDKADLSTFQHKRSGDMINAELPQNDCTFSVLDLNGDFDIYNSKATFANYLSTDTIFDIYYAYKLNEKWEYLKVDELNVYVFSRPKNGIEATFTLESSLNRATDTFLSTENISFQTYKELLALIEGKIYGTITIDGGNFSDVTKANLSGSIILASDGNFYQMPFNEILQGVACLLNTFIFRSQNGNYILKGKYDCSLNRITDTTPLDTLTLNNYYRYPEIEVISNIKKITLSLLKYPINRDNNSLDQDWTGEVGGQTVVFPPQRYSKNYGFGVDETAESKLLVFGTDTDTSRTQHFVVADGIHECYMDWMNIFISGSKRITLEVMINPAWQIGDLISVQLKELAYVKGFIIDININYAGCIKGTVTILAPKSLNV